MATQTFTTDGPHIITVPSGTPTLIVDLVPTSQDGGSTVAGNNTGGLAADRVLATFTNPTVGNWVMQNSNVSGSPTTLSDPNGYLVVYAGLGGASYISGSYEQPASSTIITGGQPGASPADGTGSGGGGGPDLGPGTNNGNNAVGKAGGVAVGSGFAGGSGGNLQSNGSSAAGLGSGGGAAGNRFSLTPTEWWTLANTPNGSIGLGNLTLAGSPAYTTNHASVANSALAFDGVNDSASFAVNWSAVNQITFTWWGYVATASIANSKEFINYGTGIGSTGGIEIAYDFGGGVGFFAAAKLNSGGQFTSVKCTQPSLDAWHFYAVSFDLTSILPGKIKVWFDGVPQTVVVNDATIATGTLGNLSLTLGKNVTQNKFLTGGMSDVRPYVGTILSDAQVLAAYNGSDYVLTSGGVGAAGRAIVNVVDAATSPSKQASASNGGSGHAVVTFPAQSGEIVQISSISASVASTGSTRSLIAESPLGTKIFEVGLPAAITKEFVFPSGLSGSKGQDVIITLDGALTTGIVSATRR